LFLSENKITDAGALHLSSLHISNLRI
jgi:hypothetical protein